MASSALRGRDEPRAVAPSISRTSDVFSRSLSIRLLGVPQPYASLSQDLSGEIRAPSRSR